MVFLPFAKMTFKTKLPVDVVLEKLKSVIEHKKITDYKLSTDDYKLFQHSYPDYPFKGELSSNLFTIVWNTCHWYSSEPIITGRIFHENGNTIIKISIKYVVPNLKSACNWFGVFTLFILYAIVDSTAEIQAAIQNRSVFQLVFQFILLILLALYTFIILFFNLTKRDTEKKFKELLDAELI